MSERNTAYRSLHDLGIATWFGGSLMGCVGLNGSAATVGDTEMDTARIASVGWKRWTPVNAGAIAVHLIGGAGVLAANAARVKNQQGVAASTVAKMAVTAAAMAATAYSGVLGAKIELVSSPEPSHREKAAKHPVDVEHARKQLAVVQWLIPALTGTVVVLNALHGEQQRPSQQGAGMIKKWAANLL
ncbi:hypothetical protein [Actinacidiphila sp. ITFR-21]|uniref:hypothetical protein n=1 Tax=Actinacidiphila sp. ITFR-21 TaxID=3075199 RepID=UPI00288C601B|nr:hypothetical protein [Streptomyces sp. ITFR-21]WNI15351.1 hypothetical protein RLT57_07275 [Streptomyces sp. ITFR-21]